MVEYMDPAQVTSLCLFVAISCLEIQITRLFTRPAPRKRRQIKNRFSLVLAPRFSARVTREKKVNYYSNRHQQEPITMSWAPDTR